MVRPGPQRTTRLSMLVRGLVSTALVAGVLGTASAVVAVPAASASASATSTATAAAAETTRFTAADRCQVYVVPDDVSQVDVELVGGAGGAGSGSNGGAGGNGGRVTARLDVTPGQSLYSVVGGNGGATPGGQQLGGGARSHGGAGGDSLHTYGSSSESFGGGGGGASFISTDDAFCGTSGGNVNGSVVLAVAGGGGGGGARNAIADAGGRGGDAGQDGAGTTTCFIFCSRGGAGGGAGTLTGPGGGGDGPDFGAGSGRAISALPTGSGTGWTYRTGGTVAEGEQYGGAGGGGWFGGGQGGPHASTYGGGGGGSSYVSPSVASPGSTPTTATAPAGTAAGIAITPAPTRRLQVTTAGSGSGSVTGGGGVDCGRTCTAIFDVGASVTLTATPGARNRFAGWSGACSGTSSTCTVTMSNLRKVGATFNLLRRVQVVVDHTAGQGSGTVSSSVTGYPCGDGCTDYETGTSVVITAAPDDRSVFRRWSGSTCADGTGGSTSTCAFTLTDRDLTYYTAFRTNVLTVHRTGAGTGTITGTVDGKACATDCSGRLAWGAVVSLKVTPGANTDGQWLSYPCDPDALTCTFTMEGSQDVLAGLTTSSRALSVTKLEDGGTITSDLDGVACPVACNLIAARLEQGTTITLRARPVTGTEQLDTVFAGWGGDCSGTGDCTVSMSAARTVTARFTRIPRYPLSTAVDGAGRGTVTARVVGAAGDPCSSPCSTTGYRGTSYTLQALPDQATSRFDHWEGACTGSGDCTVSLDGARTVTAVFSLLKRHLTVTRLGDGAGGVSSDYVRVGAFPESVQLDCGSSCEADYDHGDQVRLTAQVGEHTVFDGWSGACTGTDPDCVVSLDQARQVSATFTRDVRRLTVTTSGPGTGSVTSDVTGRSGDRVDCPGTCTLDADRGTRVTLTAVPRSADSRFAGWGGACGTSTVPTCTVYLDDAASVSAAFEPNRLTVTRDGAGSGTVSGTGISCGTTCTGDYPDNTSVRLTATADTGSTFTGWSAPCSGTGACTVAVSGARAVRATFVATPRVTVAIAGDGAAHATVVGTGAIRCGGTGTAGTTTGTCSATYGSGTTVVLTPGADQGTSTRFTGWSGACSGLGSCTLTPGDALTVTATFAHVTNRLTVSTAGTGHGRVTSQPAGITCGSVCTLDPGVDDYVALSATPDEDSVFAGWSGACTGGSDCGINGFGQATDVVATFTAKPSHTVTLSTTGTGRASFAIGDLTCAERAVCTRTVRAGTQVWLDVTPGGASTLGGWNGVTCLQVSGNRCLVQVDDDLVATVEATVRTAHVLVYQSSRSTGTGTVSSSPGGIVRCARQCGADFEYLSTVSLTATPDAGNSFWRWEPGACLNDDADATAVCQVRADALRQVSPIFLGHPITMSIGSEGGSGTGSVRVVDFGGSGRAFTCVGSCSSTWPLRANSTVQVTATPDPGMRLVRWSGCTGAVYGSVCSLSLGESDLRAVAVFEPVPQTVTISRQHLGLGTSGGTVTGAGATCSALSCKLTANKGTTITLVATPDGDSVFSGWGSACSDTTTTTCSLVVSADKSVTVRYSGRPHTVTLSRDGTGSGRFNTQYSGYSCTLASCTLSVPHGTTLQLQATPDTGSGFDGFSGACGGTATCALTVLADVSVGASYTLTPATLDVVTSGTGSGSVRSDLGGIDCPGACSASIVRGGTVTLTADPDSATSSFAGWSGDCSGDAPTCTVTLDAARSVTASFDLLPRRLTLVEAGTGSGTVTSDPSGVDCTSGCQADFVHGTTLTLSATATPGSRFDGWSGDCASTDGATCTLTLDRARAVTATFTALPVSRSRLTPASTALTYGKAGRATVTVSGPTGTVPTGTVTLLEGSTPLGTGTLVKGAAVVALPATLSAGTHTLTARYDGSPDLAPSTSAGVAVVVAKARPTVVGTLARASVSRKANAVVTVKVGAPGGTVEGTVTVLDGSKVLATGPLTGGTATFTLPLLKRGRHSLVLTYAASANLTGAKVTVPLTVT